MAEPLPECIVRLAKAEREYQVATAALTDAMTRHNIALKEHESAKQAVCDMEQAVRSIRLARARIETFAAELFSDGAA